MMKSTLLAGIVLPLIAVLILNSNWTNNDTNELNLLWTRNTKAE